METEVWIESDVSFNSKKELMAVDQSTKRPGNVLSDEFKSFKWFCVIDKEPGVYRGDSTIGDSGCEETAMKVCLLYVTNWRCLHYPLSMIADESQLNITDTSYSNQS